ncbi:MAG: cysteine desulfurase [Xanthomonadales bacterium]|nr:cysteine desulfurase [Gammaproteobacteria bacterium]NNL04353.1 cysteine desulfurase [Xanthomonadales bacterium]
MFDVDNIRAEFPALDRTVHGKPLVYFDTAATAQRPLAVIEATDRFYRRHNANVHRGVHTLSQEATDLYEGARRTLASFINARSEREVIFTRGTTEAINLVANSYLRSRLGPGDEILVSHMEHHANIVPWQMLRDATGASLKVIPITESGELRLDELESLLSERVKLLGLVHVSNALGTVNPVAEVCRMAARFDIPVLVDGAQALPHLAVDVQKLGCAFYCCSAHKVYGPTGIGALWAREETLEDMPPWQGGGEMISKVTFEKTTWNELPNKFEAGTPNIAGGVGFGAALEFVERVGVENAAAQEQHVLEYATERMNEIDEVRIIGTAPGKAGTISFTFGDVHPHDLGTIIDHYGVAIRTGHHCTMPLMQFFGVAATARASFGMYNTREEVDVFVDALLKARDMF